MDQYSLLKHTDAFLFSCDPCVPFAGRARAHKLKITFYKPPCSPVRCQTAERKKKHTQRGTKRARVTLENSGSQPERDTNVGVQVDGKGPRTLCYSTSGDAARAVDTSRTFKNLFKEARKQTGH